MEGDRKDYRIEADKKFIDDLRKIRKEIREKVKDLIYILKRDPFLFLALTSKSLKDMKISLGLELENIGYCFSVDKRKKVITLLNLVSGVYMNGERVFELGEEEKIAIVDIAKKEGKIYIKSIEEKER